MLLFSRLWILSAVWLLTGTVAAAQTLDTASSGSWLSPRALQFFRHNFVPLDPPHSYSLDSDGLKLFLDKPHGEVVSKGHINNKVAEGATFNSTFTLLYGKVTYTLSAPDIPGVVSAAILIGESGQGQDEIDVELLGGTPTRWQTNVFAPAPGEHQPLYNAFSSVQTYPSNPKNVKHPHSYTIDWSPERIVWSVDGSPVRTLHRGDTKKNGALHYPSHPMRLQFGIWDASESAGTSEWAHGPIDWDAAPHRMNAIFTSVLVECPY